MEFKISNKPNTAKKDGFYMSVEFMYGDADGDRTDEFGPMDETVFKLFGNFLKRIADEQELVRTTFRMWNMRKYADIEEKIWDEDSFYEIDDLKQEDESNLDMIPEADRELYFNEEIMDKIKEVGFTHPYDANCDKLTSIQGFWATYVKDGVECDVELVFDDSYKVKAPVTAE